MQVLCRLNTTWLVGLLDDPPMRCWCLARRVVEDGRERFVASAYLSNRAALLQAVDQKVVRGSRFYEGLPSMRITAEAKAWLRSLPPRLEPVVSVIRPHQLENPHVMPGAHSRLVVVPPWPSNWDGLAA